MPLACPPWCCVLNDYLNKLRACAATVPMAQYDVPEGSRRLRRLNRFILLSKCERTKRKTSPETSRWQRKAICFALRAPGGLLGAPRCSSWRFKGAQEELVRIHGAAESLQNHPISFPKAPRSSQMFPARARKRFQNHHRIENVGFWKMLIFLK